MMRILLIDPFSGVAGDMWAGALLDAGVPLEVIRRALDTLPVQGFVFEAGPVRRAGFAATKARVVLHALGGREEGRAAAGPASRGHHEHPHADPGGGHHHAPPGALPAHDHHGMTPREMLALFERSGLAPGARELAGRAVRILGEAEARSHGRSFDEVHFHEVGALDAVVDIAAFAAAVEHLRPDRVYARPLCVGRGMIACAHGQLPVPGPAVTEMVGGWPLTIPPFDAELATPTGVACLRALDPIFGEPPPFRLLARGSGAGTDDRPERPNILRVLLGEVLETGGPATEEVCVLACDVDDMSGEEIGALRRQLQGRVLDLTVLAVQMKKDRPGIRLECLVHPGELESVAAFLLEASSSFGLRWRQERRWTLPRRMVEVEVEGRSCRVKVGQGPGGAPKFHAEAEDVMAIAAATGRRFSEVAAEAEWAARIRE
jgi:uncharacterized protein (TIGR00299 family) protein